MLQAIGAAPFGAIGVVQDYKAHSWHGHKVAERKIKCIMEALMFLGLT